MRPAGAIGAVLFAVVSGASAQTFQTFRMMTPQTNVVTVPAGSMCELVSASTSWGYPLTSSQNGLSARIEIIYPEATNSFALWWINGTDTSTAKPIFGPCVLSVIASATNAIFAPTLKQTPVNVAPVPSLVAPAGRAAALIVETSTNMQTWQTITNAPFPRSESHRFFRTRLEVSP